MEFVNSDIAQHSAVNFQRRIMRQITIAVAIGFVVLTIIVAFIVVTTGSDRLYKTTEEAYETAASDMSNVMDDVIAQAVSIGSGANMQSYAAQIYAASWQTDDDSSMFEAQTTVLRSLDDLISRNSEYLLAARYLSRDGTIWAEVSYFDGRLNVSRDIRQSDFITDEAFAQVIEDGQPGLPFYSEVVFDGSLGTDVFYAYIPVTLRESTANILGVLQIEMKVDIYRQHILNLASQISSEQVSRQILLVDSTNYIIIDSNDNMEDTEIVEDLVKFISLNADDYIQRFINRTTVVSSAQITRTDGVNMPWRIVIVSDYGETIFLYFLLVVGVFGFSFLMLAGLLATINYVLAPFLRPLTSLTETASHLVAGRSLDEDERGRLRRAAEETELGYLLYSFSEVAARMERLSANVIHEADRRSRDLEIAGRIGREVATLRDVDLLLNRTINMICNEFGFYHAQVFLVDDAGMDAVLAYSRGRAGEQLLAQKFKIPVASDTVIGKATATKRPIVINDTQRRAGKPHGFNPLLPDTRAELGMPLMSGDEVIGVLDIQSKTPDVFMSEDIPVFALLADQLAVAIVNTRLMNQSAKRIEQIDMLNRQLTRHAWEDADNQINLQNSYLYDLMNVETLDIAPLPPQGAVSTAISIRGEVIGELVASPTEGRSFTDGDRVILQAVSNRIALAVENARLFQETQVSLAETSTLYDLTRSLNEAGTLGEVLQSMIGSVMTDAIGGQIWMFEGQDEDEHRIMTVVADYAVVERESANNRNLTGLTINVDDHVFLRNLNMTQVGLINNMLEDRRLDTTLKLVLQRMGTIAAVFIPLVVRGVWRGIVMIEFGEVREFSEREGRIFMALIDQAGVAIDNRLLLQQTEEEVARNENLYAASRIINTARNMQDLVYAVVATTPNPDLQYALTLLEGAFDKNGWPSRGRMVARSEDTSVREMELSFEFIVADDSPLRKREPEIIVDPNPENQNVPPRVKWMRSLRQRFMAIFPLFSANQPLALFHVMADKPYKLSANDYEVYGALAGQMSSQIQIRRLLTRTELALDEARRLYMATRAITGAPDSEHVYQVAVEHLVRPFEQVEEITAETIQLMVLLADQETGQLQITQMWGDVMNAKVGQMLSMEDYPLQRLTASTTAALHFSNISSDAILAGEARFRSRLVTARVRSIAIAPIKTRQNWFGAIIAQSKDDHVFDDQYLRFLMAVADQVAIALDNKRLFEEAQAAAAIAQLEARRALTLADAAQLTTTIGATTDLAVGLDKVFERVAEEGAYNRWMLLNFSSTDANRLDVVIVRSAEESHYFESNYAVTSQIPIVTAARENRSIIVNDMDDNPAMSATIIHLFGRHVAVPVTAGDQVFGALAIGRNVDLPEITMRDAQLISTLAIQVGLALENRRLFQRAQSEQRTLRSILETMPAGVLVLDSESLLPIQFNEQARIYLGGDIQEKVPFSVEGYNLYRTGTDVYYPADELPIFLSLESGLQESSDDIAVVIDDQQIDLLVNAAPITNSRGDTTAVVVAFQDITNLRTLENTLQENLRETVALYEAQRQFSEAEGLEEVLDVIIMQLILQQPVDAYILALDETGNTYLSRYFMTEDQDPDILAEFVRYDQIHRITGSAINELSEDAKALLDRVDASSIISLPLNVSILDQPLGWMIMLSDNSQGFPVEHDRIITQLGEAAATALENRMLFQRQLETVREVENLYNATNAVSRSRDINQLTAVLKNSLKSMDVDYFCGYLLSSAGLTDDTFVLFNESKHGDPIAFYDLLTGYDIPESGVFVGNIESLSVLNAVEQRLLDAGINAFGVLGLRPKDGTDGYLVVGYRDAHRFVGGEERYLNTLADGASVVFNNIILFNQIQSALEETSILYQASRALSDATSAHDILDVVVNYLIGPHVHQVFIAQLESRNWDILGASVKVVASWALEGTADLQGVMLKESEFPAWGLLKSSDVLLINDIQKANLSDIENMTLQGLSTESLVIIPLRVANRDIGAIWIGANEPFNYADKELRTYQAFAEQASLSLEAAYLLAETERRARQLEASAEVTQSAGKILDLEVLLPQVVNLIRDAFNYDHVQIFMMDDRNDYAELRASTGEPGEKLLANKHKLQKGSLSVIGRVTQTGKPQIALDTADADVVHVPNVYLPLTRSEIALPLIIKDNVIGALDVQSNEPNAFNNEDVGALTTLAAQISVAIENANLYESAQQQADQMEFLFAITSAAAAAETLEDSLIEVSEGVYHSLNPLSVVFYLPQVYMDDEGNSFDTLRAAALSGVDQPLREIAEVRVGDPTSLLSEVAATKRPFVIEDIQAEERYLPIVPSALSALILPLVAGNDVIGVLVMEDARYNAYGYETLQILLPLAGSVSGVVRSLQFLEQLTRSNEQLRELDRLKSDFLANMSHELRTPLNSIIGFSRVMLKGIDGPLTEMQEQDLNTIYTSGQHLLNLINDILDQAKIAAGKMDVKPEFFDVKPLLEGVRSIGIGTVKDKRINMLLEVAPNIPKAYGDEFRTRQVLINLVSNAGKFTEEGSITIRAYPVNESGIPMVRIDVIDTGIGIAENDLPLLFEAFRQVDSSLTRTQGGTGLGLPIAKSLVELQGGEMTVHSVVNQGSTFSITIPVEMPKDDEDGGEADQTKGVKVFEKMDEDIDTFNPPTMPLSPSLLDELDETGTFAALDKELVETKPTAPTGLRPHPGPSKKLMQTKREVILIEDDKGMVDQFRRTLQREGFDVVTADHPSYAEAMVSNMRPTMLVMDVNFSSGEGWHILERLKDRDDTFDIPIIVVTLSNESERAYQIGCYKFIQRPFMPEELVEAALAAEKESNMERILIIDDQPDDIRLLTQLLNEHGTYRVFSAASGVEGISLVARRRPDLVILDLRMPEMDGFAVLQELRSNPETSDIPVIVVTGEISLNDDEQNQLSNIHILHKTDISQEEYDQFIKNVRKHLDMA